jgi:hypothetical protein
MSARISQSIATIAVGSTILASCFAVGVPANTAVAADCLTAPNPSTPSNGHWYYRTDRTQQRKCWYLHTDNEPSAQSAMQVARATLPAKPLQSGATADPIHLRASRTSWRSTEGPTCLIKKSKNSMLNSWNGAAALKIRASMVSPS